MKKEDLILREVLERVEPPKEDLDFIKGKLKEFLKRLNSKINSSKLDIEVFIGGSYAKKTLIKKYKYDIDIFLRFGKNHKGDISESTKKLLGNFKEVFLVHGSRDYFNIKISPSAFFEIVPVARVKNPSEAENITDLSFSHVKYINKKIKNKKILDDIRIAKAFCHANNCYGAESYIRGFSGYGLELLVYHYKGFLKFIRAIAKSKPKEKIIIDIEKQHKNKSSILLDLNESKLQSPIILIDPTYKQRNVLAALSDKTFERFRKECQKFLKSPSIESFEESEIDLEQIKNHANKNKQEFILLEAKTTKPEGDVAGSKLLKFYNHLEGEISNFFEIKNKGFDYNDQKSAKYFFVVKQKKEILIKGPFSEDKINVQKFKKKHKSTFVKDKKVCAKVKVNSNLREFIQKWKIKNSKRIKEMYIEGLEIV